MTNIIICTCLLQGRLDAFGGPEAKIDYLILDAKFLLINMNYVEFFFLFFRNFIDRKSLKKIFMLVVAD